MTHYFSTFIPDAPLNTVHVIIYVTSDDLLVLFLPRIILHERKKLVFQKLQKNGIHRIFHYVLILDIILL
jgi:hypothetical protein